MGQTYTDYVEASRKAAHAALKMIHALEELKTPELAELFKGHVLTLTECNRDRKNRPSANTGEEDSIIIEREATSGNLTSFFRVRKLVAEARPVRNENGELPYPFNTPTIIPSGISSILVDLNALAPGKQVLEDLLAGHSIAELSAVLNRPLTKAETEALAKGKLQSLTFDGLLSATFKKRYGFMGSGFLALNVWNESYSTNKWALHIHEDGGIFAEYLCLTNYVKKNHL